MNVDKEVDVYVDEFEKHLGEDHLMQSSVTGLITTQDQPVNLV